MHHRWIILLVLFFCIPATEVFGETYRFQAFGAPSPYSVSVADYVWFDAGRGRSVPVRIHRPVTAAESDADAGPFPVILFSTGLGCGREDCAYLARHWARCGYVSVHVQHKGSDRELRHGNLQRRKGLQNWRKSAR